MIQTCIIKVLILLIKKLQGGHKIIICNESKKSIQDSEPVDISVNNYSFAKNQIKILADEKG